MRHVGLRQHRTSVLASIAHAHLHLLLVARPAFDTYNDQTMINTCHIPWYTRARFVVVEVGPGTGAARLAPSLAQRLDPAQHTLLIVSEAMESGVDAADVEDQVSRTLFFTMFPIAVDTYDMGGRRVHGLVFPCTRCTCLAALAGLIAALAVVLVAFVTWL